MSKGSNKSAEKKSNTVLNSISILAILISVLSLISVILEVFYVEDGSIYIYAIKGLTILYGIVVIFFSRSEAAVKRTTIIAHTLVISIALSLLLAIYFYPVRFQMNIILLGVFLFLVSIGISWKVLNQIAAVAYSAILAGIIIQIQPKIDVFSLDLIQGSSIFMIFSLVSIVTSFLVSKFRVDIKSEIKKNIVVSEIDKLDSEQVVQNQDLYRFLIENSKIGLFNCDTDGNYKFVTDSFHTLFAYDSKAALLKSKLFDLFLADTNGKEVIKNLIKRKGKIKNYKTKLRKKDGTKIIANLNVNMIKNNDTDENFYTGSIEDITQRYVKESNLKKEIEELQKEKDQNVQMVLQAKHAGTMKAQFLANMTHEIKTPINSVIGFLSLIEKGMFESIDELKEFAANTRIAVDSLFDIVTNVLDISKIEAGKLELDNIQFNFHEEVAKAKSIITPKAMEKELKLHFEIASGIPKSMYGDPTRLRQVMVNLLTNSVKNTDSGEVSLTADIINKSMDSVKIKVSVTDTGRGIPEDKLKILFKPYTQIKNKKGTEKEGTGLGLMITKQFVSLMGGKIEVHSDEGIGTTVEFTCVINLSATTMARLNADDEPDEMEEQSEENLADSLDELDVKDTGKDKKIDKPVEEPEEDDLPEIINEPEIIEIPNNIKLDEVPVEAKIPEVAKPPEKPVVPEVSKEPEKPAVPEVAKPPEKPVVPEVAKEPEKPVIPEANDEPELIDVPDDIKLDQAPSVETKKPEVDKVPEKPVVPEVVKAPEEPELPDIPSPVKKMPENKNGKKILLVEDNPISQKVERKILVEFGYNVETVSNGKEAIEAVEREPFNIILMDIQMPDMDGITATKKIRALGAPMNKIPIIAVTAHSSMKDREMCLASGMDDYIAKPININFLRMTIEQWISRDHS